ncbi:MAG TPA: DUF2066 domain-containing protein [Alphaproteobacteria bacterium]|nr:DUF2066 domain-containing protein [Alphaproteobacteria bacterium]
MIQPRSLRRVTVFVVVLVLCAILSAGGAKAESVYTIRDLAVDSSAVSAAEARSLALAKGQRAAFDRLLRRLVLSEDQVLLPVLEYAQITALVDGYVIEKELLSSTRYRANLTIDFNKFGMRNLLRQRKIRFAETRSNDVLVVPVYDTGDGPILWLGPGDWRAAWLARPANERLLPLILPLGDVIDMAAMDAALAMAPSREALLGLAERYGTQEVVVASAYLELPEPPEPTAEGNSNDGITDVGDGTGNDAERVSVAETGISKSRWVRGPVEGAILQLTVHRVGAAAERTTRELLRGAPSDSRESLLARAVGRVMALVEGNWKQANMLRFGRENELRIAVPLNSLGDWVDMRRRLRDLAVVVSIDLAALSRGQADILLHYFGEREQLMLGLEQSDLALNFESGGWVLHSNASGGQSGTSGNNL